LKKEINMAKNEERRSAIDPAVRSALGSDGIYGRLARERKMTASQRKKAAADRQRNRIMIDLPEEMQAVLDRMAEAEGLPRSQVMCWLVALGLQHFERGALIDARVASRSMRWEFTLDVPAVGLPSCYDGRLEQKRD
jgi:hypothetical protein